MKNSHTMMIVGAILLISATHFNNDVALSLVGSILVFTAFIWMTRIAYEDYSDGKRNKRIHGFYSVEPQE